MEVLVLIFGLLTFATFICGLVFLAHISWVLPCIAVATFIFFILCLIQVVR